MISNLCEVVKEGQLALRELARPARPARRTRVSRLLRVDKKLRSVSPASARVCGCVHRFQRRHLRVRPPVRRSALAPLRAEMGWRGAGNCHGVSCVDILQLVRSIFSLYILNFTFYTLLGTPRSRLPYALKWASEGQDYQLPTINYQLPHFS